MAKEKATTHKKKAQRARKKATTPGNEKQEKAKVTAQKNKQMVPQKIPLTHFVPRKKENRHHKMIGNKAQANSGVATKHKTSGKTTHMAVDGTAQAARTTRMKADGKSFYLIELLSVCFFYAYYLVLRCATIAYLLLYTCFLFLKNLNRVTHIY